LIQPIYDPEPENECLNGMIWERCPKTTYEEQETVALATYLAVLKFNDGDIFYL
jgi:hypothetical protein